MLYNIAMLIFFVGLPLLVGFGASQLSVNSAAAYASFVLPPWAPPGAIFGIVWTVLYVLMGLAAYMVWNSKGQKHRRKTALRLYFLQLAVNFFWTYFFFALQWRLFAFFWLLLLLTLLFFCMQKFKQISLAAYVFLSPYFLWCLFAAYLNISIYILNT